MSRNRHPGFTHVTRAGDLRAAYARAGKEFHGASFRETTSLLHGKFCSDGKIMTVKKPKNKTQRLLGVSSAGFVLKCGCGMLVHSHPLLTAADMLENLEKEH